MSDDNVFATKVYQKNSKLKKVALVDADGDVVDLTGAELYFVVSNNSELFSKSIGDGVTVTDAESGEIEIQIDAADNDVSVDIYKQELLLIDVENNRYSSLTGQYRVLESITTGKGD